MPEAKATETGTMSSNSGGWGAKKPAVHILAAMGREAWAITPQALETIVAVAGRMVEAPDAVLSKRGDALEGAGWRTQVRDGVAVIPVRGPIFRHSSMFTEICGASSVQALAIDIAAAVDDPAVKGLVLDIDSPGGQVTGINELAGQIRAACERKRVVAYVGGLGASAAYWLASAAGEIVADRTAELGSIGVVAAYTDTSARDAAEGVKTLEIVSSQSPKKRLSPTTKEGKAAVQTLVDGLADVFVETVAANRGKSPDDVMENFGQGGVMLAEAAVAVGMADRLGSLEGVISEIAATGGGVLAVGSQAHTEANEMPSEKREDVLTADAVDAAWLAANRPDTVASIKAEAVKEERARVASILDLKIKGHDELVGNAMSGDTTAEGLALAVLKAEQGTREKLAEDIQSDAEQITIAPSAGADGPDADASERAAYTKNVASAMNAGRA